MKIYTKIWKLWVHPDYDHLYIPLTSNYSQFQLQTIFLGNNNPFSIKPTVVQVKISKITSIFLVWNLFTSFKVGRIMVLKYGHLMLPGSFPDKVTPAIDFTDEAVVQCDVPVIKILL